MAQAGSWDPSVPACHPPPRSHSYIPFPRDSSPPHPRVPTIWVGLCFSPSLGLSPSPGPPACVSSCVSPPPVTLPTVLSLSFLAPPPAASRQPCSGSLPLPLCPQPPSSLGDPSQHGRVGREGGAAPAPGPGAGLTQGLAHCRLPWRQLQPRRGGTGQPRELAQPDPRQGAPQAPRRGRQEPPRGGPEAQAPR